MYGENTEQLRAELSTLLRHHRIQQRLGGKGIHTVPETTTAAEREELGHQIARFRHMVLLWCLQASDAATPSTDLNDITLRPWRPVEVLRYQLGVAIAASGAGPASLAELTTAQRFPMVETWRLAAKAAALGEHDFAAGVDYGRLNDDQCMAVVKDAAEITRALVVLDLRYAGIPGWNRLKGHVSLAHAAEACSVAPGRDGPNYSVDLRGWRPPATLNRDPARAGLSGILQSEHNLLVSLEHFPNAHSLRMALTSQLIVSHETGTRTSGLDPALLQKWQQRAETYLLLTRETRDVRGLLGLDAAAPHAATVAYRAQNLPVEPVVDRRSSQLDQIFSRIDACLAAIIEHGVSQRLYLKRVALAQLAEHSQGLIHPLGARYDPISSPVQTSLIPIVRSRLRPAPEPVRPSKDAGRSRADFEAAFTHRPARRGAAPDVPSL